MSQLAFSPEAYGRYIKENRYHDYLCHGSQSAPH